MQKEDIFIGCSGFYNYDWKGLLYPEDIKSKDFLKLYSQQFNSVEINSTFYRKPNQTTLKKWVEETPEDFRFFIKIPKKITHIQRLAECRNEIEDFCFYISENLQQKLAGFLYQFPPSFKNTDENRDLISENITGNFLDVAEFRHESWFNEEIYKFLKSKNIVFSGTSFPGKIPDLIIANHPEILYYRLHGNPVLYKSEYSEDFLDNLASEIIKQNRKCFVFFNNTWGTAAVKNAVALQNLLKEKL